MTVGPEVEQPLLAMRRYALAELKSVKGWLQPGALFMIWAVLETQLATGVRGDIAEIGVYHGRTFFLLAKSRRPGEQAYAIDPFQMQPEGDFYGTFEANRQRLAVTDVALHVIRCTASRL